mgnify:CR=1 FL=1
MIAQRYRSRRQVESPQQPELKVDICNVCHPFYTGKLKYVDTAGRIDKFKKKFATTGYASLKRGKKKAATTEGGDT